MKKIKLFLAFIFLMIFSLSINVSAEERKYLDDVLSIDRKTFLRYMIQSEVEGKYLGTRYIGLDWNNLNFEQITDPNVGFNCAGFIYRAFLDAGANISNIFDGNRYPYKGAGVTDWLRLIQDKGIYTDGDSPISQSFRSGEYTDIMAYDSIDSLLASGLKKGEVVILIPDNSSICDTHVGFYWGDDYETENTSTSFWHSSDPENHITQIREKENSPCTYQYVALKFKSQINVTKHDSKFNHVQGIKFGLYSDSEATNLIAEATTDEMGYAVFEGIIDGTKYYIKEISVLDGYVINTSIEEVVAGDFVDFVNEPTTVEISKTSIADSKELPGATLQILDENKKEISCNIKEYMSDIKEVKDCKWVSGEEPISVLGLKAGTYYLVEVNAPKGYALSKEEPKFVVKNDGSITKVKMQNKIKEVEVPNTLLNSKLMIVIGIVITFVGIGTIIYVKAKMKLVNKL